MDKMKTFTAGMARGFAGAFKSLDGQVAKDPNLRNVKILDVKDTYFIAGGLTAGEAKPHNECVSRVIVYTPKRK